MYEIKSHKTFGFLILVCFIVGMAFIAPVSALTHITDATGLQNMNLNLAEDYVLDNDIDLSGVTWTPIATGGQFVGSFDGAGYTISNLELNLPSTSNVGLFSVASSGASFKNLILDGFTITGENNVGGLIGRVVMSEATHDWCIIDNVDVINSVIHAKTSYAGSIYGYGQTYAYVRMNDCDVSDGKVTTGSSYCGGLVGYGAYTSSVLEMTECTAVRMSVTTGSNYCGGLVGTGAYTSSVLNVTDCIVRDSVITTGSYACGGLVGLGAQTSSVLNLNGNEVENCVITTGSNACGGLVGLGAYTSAVLNVNDCEVNECTVVARTTSAGGIVGETYQSVSTITNSFVTDTTVLSETGKAGGIGGNLGTVNIMISTCNVANVNVKGTTTYTFAEVYEVGSCTSSDITNVAGLKIKALSLSITTPKNAQPVFTLQRQGAVVRTDGSGFVDTSLGYAWTWGDGSTGVDFSDTPTHIYNSAGDYTASVIITNAEDLVGSSKSASFSLYAQDPTILTPSTDSILISSVEYTFTSDESNNVVWDFGDGTTAATESATHAYSASGTYNVSLTVSNAFGSDTAYHVYTVVNYADITNVTATLLSTEQITLNTYASQRYNPVQQYGLSASVLDIKYVSSSDAYMVSGNTPYYINAKTSVITPVSNYVGSNAVLCAIDESGIVIYDTEKVISYYSYATGTRQIIKMVDGVTSITLGKAYSPEVNVITYTTTVNTYYYRIDTGVTYSSTTSSIYNGIVGNPYNKMFLSWNNVNPSNVTISYLNAGVVEDSTHHLALTAGTTIQSIQSIDNTNNFIVRTTNKIFVVEVIGGSFNLISTSAGAVPAFSEVRADQQLEYMGLNETSVYFVDDTGNLSTYYSGIAQLNTLSLSAESGIWSAFGGNDMRLTVLGRASPTTWNVSDIISFSSSINKVALSTGGYYLTVVSDGSLYLLSQATPESSDTILTTKYYLQVYLMENGQYLDNTRFTVGIGRTAPTTYTSDASGSCVVEVVPSRTYTIAFSDGSKSTTYIANNFALQYLILSKPATSPVASGLTSDVSLDYRLVHMSYFDSDGRNNLVTFTVWNATTILQTYSSVTNNVAYVYDATESDDSYLAVVLHVSNPDSGYTYDKSYTVWLKKYADPTNQTGLILPGAKKPLIPAPFWSDVGLPVKLDGELIQLIICGILMVIAGLFGAQHSAKGALLVAGIAAIFTVLGLLVIDPIWIAMMVVIGVLAVFSYARDYD